MDAGSVSKRRQVVATLAVLIVIAVIVAGVTLSQKGTNSDTNTTTSTVETNTTATESSTQTTVSNADYKDGTYSATGGYNSPGGAEAIDVTVTLKDGVVTSTSAEGQANGGEAEFHQQDFIGAFKELVVGKSIDDLKLSRVAGASLTTQGFNNAISQIKSQAQS